MRRLRSLEVARCLSLLCNLDTHSRRWRERSMRSRSYNAGIAALGQLTSATSELRCLGLNPAHPFQADPALITASTAIRLQSNALVELSICFPIQDRQFLSDARNRDFHAMTSSIVLHWLSYFRKSIEIIRPTHHRNVRFHP